MSAPVVVTGMAIWSPFGRGLEPFWEGLLGIRCARRPVTRINSDHWAYRARIAADVPEVETDEHGRSEASAIKIMTSVAQDLIAEFGRMPSDVSPYDVGLCLGASQSGSNTMFQDYLHLRRGEAVAVDFRSASSWLSSAALLSELGRTLGSKGPSLVVSTACASGTSSIGVAYDWIRLGRTRAAFAGGVGYFSQVSFSGFNILRLTGPSGCHPFDRKRDGMMLGDGFALVALESENDARRRGAPVLGRIVGYSCGNEAHHATAPDPSGTSAFNVMWKALGCSKARLEQLDYINAHGTGTLANDAAELVAVTRLLAMRQSGVPVLMSSTKGAHGHCLGGAGSVEFIAVLMTLNRGMIPPTLGLEDPEECCDRLKLVLEPTPKRVRLALSNSFAFGGNVASIALEAFQ